MSLETHSSSLSKNVDGMRRYIDLVSYLAPYDYMGAFKAWGNFYYFFEEVYENNPPKVFFTVPFLNIFIGAKSQSEALSNEKKMEDTIRAYGWLYLHHAFEINSKSDESLKMIYNALPMEDQIKADEARKKYYETHAIGERDEKRQNRWKKNNLPTDEELIELKSILLKDPNAGMIAWKKIIHTLDNMKKIPKETLHRYMDQLLWEMSNLFTSRKVQLISAKVYKAPLLKYNMPSLFYSILEDNWLTEFYFRNSQSHYSIASEIASILLIQNEIDRLKEVLQFTHDNKYIDFDKFINNMYTYAYSEFDRMRNYISDSKEFFLDADNKNKGSSIEVTEYSHYYRFIPSYATMMYYVNLESEFNWKTEFLSKCGNIERQINLTLGRLTRLEEAVINA